MDNQKEILAKLQGLDEQAELLTQLLIAFIISGLFEGRNCQLFSLRNEIEKIIADKGCSDNLQRIFDALN